VRVKSKEKELMRIKREKDGLIKKLLTKIFSRFFVTSNLTAHEVLNIDENKN